MVNGELAASLELDVLLHSKQEDANSAKTAPREKRGSASGDVEFKGQLGVLAKRWRCCSSHSCPVVCPAVDVFPLVLDALEPCSGL